MSYINRSQVIKEFQELIQKDLNKKINYMPEEFNAQQLHALNLFKQRIFLEEVIEETIAFNRSLVFDPAGGSIKLTNSAEELVEVFKLRSDVYGGLNYQDEFPDTIEGLNFDIYDKKAAIFYYQKDSKATGTCRLIFDSKNKLPSETKMSFDSIREKYNTIGELSRLIVRNEKKGLNLEFKNLMQAIYIFFMNNNIDITLLAIIKDHYKLYTKFGGSEIISDMDENGYGNLGIPTYLLTWDPSQVSNFFKKMFLNQK